MESLNALQLVEAKMWQRIKEQKEEIVKLKQENWRHHTNGTLWREVWEEQSPKLFRLRYSVYATHPVSVLGLDQAPVHEHQHYIGQLSFLVHTQPASECFIDLVQPQAGGIFQAQVAQPPFLAVLLLSKHSCLSTAGRWISKRFPLVF